MIPYSDGIPARRFPIVNVTLIVVNFAVFLFYELPNGEAAVNHASFYPCDVTNACHLGIPWGVSWVTAMFLHAGWDHILGNMLFLAIFGKNVEDAFGRLGYLVLYFAGGFAAIMLQTAMTLLFGTASDAQIPTLGGQRGDRGCAGRLHRALSRLTRPHLRGVVSDADPGVVFPRCMVSVPILRGQLRAGPPRQRGWQRCRVLRPCGWLHLRCAHGDSSHPHWTNRDPSAAIVLSS
jgi:hypothetical protein